MEKSQSFGTSTILYPHPSNEQALQQEMHKESRLLWATLTPHGTRHFISPAGEYANYEDHYEIVDYRAKTAKTTPKKVPIKVHIRKKSKLVYTDYVGNLIYYSIIYQNLDF